MNALEYFRTDVSRQAITCDVLRKQDTNSYGGNVEETGETVEIAVFSSTAVSDVVSEGTDETTTQTGLIVPQYDVDGNPTETVRVTDHLRPQTNTAIRYTVRSKVGLPNDIDPELWRVGLEKTNSSA